jgi:hypothetical protein
MTNNPSNKVKWDDEHDARIREMHAAGYAAEDIAVKLNKENDGYQLTRNAVIGRLWRLGLSTARGTVTATPRNGSARLKRPTPAAAPPEASPPLAPAAPPEASPPVKRRPRRQWQPREPVPLVDLQPDDCRWPVTLTRPWGFCGASKMRGSPYCLGHTRMALTRG